MTSDAALFDTLKYRIDVSPITGTRRYYNHAGQLHREDGPAIEYSDGTKYWYRNGKLHREDGPAIIHDTGTRKWLVNGELHRTDGPAIESSSYCEWRIWGTRYTEEEYHQRLKTLGADAQQNCVQSIEMQH